MHSSWAKRVVTAVAFTVMLPMAVAVAGNSATASAAFTPSGFDFWVNDANNVPLKSRIFRAANGNTNRVVYALDGLRARNDLNGWEIETDVANILTRQNFNVVMPVGGENSFYSDWEAPSTFFGDAGSSGSSTGSSQKLPYRMESFLTKQLPNALSSRLGFSSHRNGIFGLSMGGSAALTMAAYHPNQFSYAGSFSGYLNVSAPGMKEAMRLAMLSQNGYNIDAMWGPPWDPNWLRNDPFVFAPRLRDNGQHLWVSAGSGLPGEFDHVTNPVDLFNLGNAMGLEAIALANTRAFSLRMATLGANNNVHYDFPPVGTHSWGWWQDQVIKMAPDMSRYIG